MEYNRTFLRKLKENYFMSKALYETVKEQAEEIEKKILLEYEFYESEEIAKMKKSRGGNGSPKRILEPFNTFLMEESDFNRYLDLAYSEYVKSGIADPRGKDYIPEAEEKALYHEAEQQLIDYAIEIIPDFLNEKVCGTWKQAENEEQACLFAEITLICKYPNVRYTSCNVVNVA